MLRTEIPSIDAEKLQIRAAALAQGTYEIARGTALSESGLRSGIDFLLDAEEVRDLLIADDESFVDRAYRAILGRAPDAEAHFLAKMQSGEYTRLEVVAFLRFSPEGRSVSCRLPNPRQFLLLALSTRLPVSSPRRWMNRRLERQFGHPGGSPTS